MQRRITFININIPGLVWLQYFTAILQQNVRVSLSRAYQLSLDNEQRMRTQKVFELSCGIIKISLLPATKNDFLQDHV